MKDELIEVLKILETIRTLNKFNTINYRAGSFEDYVIDGINNLEKALGILLVRKEMLE